MTTGCGRVIPYLVVVVVVVEDKEQTTSLCPKDTSSTYFTKVKNKKDFPVNSRSFLTPLFTSSCKTETWQNL